MSSEPLQEAYRLIREGNRQEAQRLLVPFVRADPLNADAWWLLANALDDPEKQLRSLERVLKLRPDDDRAQRMYDRLRGTPPSQPLPIEISSADVFDSGEEFDAFIDEEPTPRVRVHKSRGGRLGTIILALIGLFTVVSCALCVLTLVVSAPVISRVVQEVVLTITSVPGFATLASFATPAAPSPLPADLTIRGSIESGQTVQGSVDALEDEGWTFSADAGERIIIELNAVDAALDPQLYLYAPDDQLVAENDDIDGENNRNSRIEIMLTQGGSYTLRVSAFSDGGDYDLTLNRADE